MEHVCEHIYDGPLPSPFFMRLIHLAFSFWVSIMHCNWFLFSSLLGLFNVEIIRKELGFTKKGKVMRGCIRFWNISKQLWMTKFTTWANRLNHNQIWEEFFLKKRLVLSLAFFIFRTLILKITWYPFWKCILKVVVM